MSLTLHNISKYFGNQAALEQVSFQVQDGEIAGFLGPNGAGKSTLMKIATGFLKADEGFAEINGMIINESNMEIRRHIGYLPEHNPLYPDLYVKEYLLYIAGLYHLGKKSAARVDEIIERTGLTSEYKKQIGALSKGYRQRVGLAQALMHDPEVLILDEPTTGLDPNQLEEIRQLIREMGKEKTVLFSTHIMQEVKALCKRVVIIHRGHIVADGTEEELLTLNTKGDTITHVEFSQPIEMKLLKTIEEIHQIVPLSANYFEVHSNEDVRALLFRFAVVHQLEILTLKHQQHTMEDIFRELTLNE